MSSITFPDGSNYELVDDKARKDITELNNNVDNVQGDIDELSDNVEDVQTRVDRLYDVEQIWFHDTFTTPTKFKEYYTYTAKKKCIINLTYNAIYNNQPPQHSRINVGSTTVSEINDTNPSSHHLLTLNYILNAGDVVKCLSVYKGESSNQVRVVGYVQYLE